MKCSVCGADNRDDVRFCRRCGNALVTPAPGGPGERVASAPASGSGQLGPGITCPACGAMVRAGTQFCPQCGHAMPGPALNVAEGHQAGGDLPEAALTETGSPSTSSPQGEASDPGAPAPRRRFRRWPLWVGGAVGFAGVAVLLAVLLVRLLGDGSPLAAPEPMVTATAVLSTVSSATPTPQVTPTSACAGSSTTSCQRDI